MSTQEGIIRGCTHPERETDARSEVRLSKGVTVYCCCDCWNRSVTARRAEEKARLNAEPRCEVPGCRHRANVVTVGGLGLCGRHMKRAEAAAQRAAAGTPLMFGGCPFTRADVLAFAQQ